VPAPVLTEVDALGPQLRARSAEIEAARTLPVDLVKQLAEIGAFKLFVPARYGGAEVSPLDGIAVTEALAHADGAAGWCQMIAMTTGVLAGYLPAAHAAAIYESPSAITGGFAAPVGRAKAVPQGLMVSGRWQWGSFTAHCTTIGGGVRLEDGSSRFAYFDRDDVELLDTWYVAGLKGTGSTDYQVHDALVPEGRWVEVGASAPVEDGALYRFSFFGLLAIGVAAVALGLARRSIDELVALAGMKTPQGSSRPLSERGATQSDVAIAEAELRAARALVDDVVGAAWGACERGGTPDDEQRRSIRLAATHATQTAATVVDRMYTTGGGAAIFEDSALQRVFRDVHVATQHAITAPRTMELVGRLKLGLDTDTRQL
jgi:alkylation response protein AidB-like acyl-CoA dehydrogenase